MLQSLRFKSLSSDDDDSDNDNDKPLCIRKSNDDIDDSHGSITNPNICPSSIKPSSKLEIIDDKNSNIKKKFSLWTDVLMEQQLTDTIDETLQIKDRRAMARRRKRLKIKQQTNDPENYFQWTQEDFEKKFTAKKSADGILKTPRKRNRKPGIVGEIAHKLKEPRTDIIKNIVEVLGEERTRKLVAEVLDIEDVGGLMINDDNNNINAENDGTNNNQPKRKRTPGGALFYLVKHDSTISDEQKRIIFGNREVREFNRNLKKKLKYKRQNNVKNNKINKNKKKKKSKKCKKK